MITRSNLQRLPVSVGIFMVLFAGLFGSEGCVLADNLGKDGISDEGSACGPASASPDGNPCRCDADCINAEAVCGSEAEIGTPRGLCIVACDSPGGCDELAMCDSGLCWPECDESRDCPIGRICLDPVESTVEGPGICVSHCQSNDQCLSGSCNRYSGYCLDENEVPEGRGTAEPCSSDEDCKSGYCDIFGSCSSLCDARYECPDEAFCAGLIRDVGLCTIPCESDADCEGLALDTCTEYSDVSVPVCGAADGMRASSSEDPVSRLQVHLHRSRTLRLQGQTG